MAYRDERLDLSWKERGRILAGGFLGLVWVLFVLFCIVIVGGSM